MKIRKANVEDIQRIYQLDIDAFGKSLGIEFIEKELLTNPLSHYYVCVLKKEVIGYLGIRIDENADILNFVIDPNYQRHGYGNKLLDYAIKQCKKHKCLNITLEVRESNIKAINLYEKKGFRNVSTRENYYSNGEDALFLVKELIHED